MAVFGVDFGNLNSVVSVARKGGIDVIVNEVSKRETSSLVSFGEKERYLGEKALDLKIRNWQNTVGSLKRLLGIKFNSEAASHERKFVKNELRADENGYIEVRVNYKFKERWFKPEQLIGMLFTNLRSQAEKEVAIDAKASPGSIKVVDCVVSCPIYYTTAQRHLLLQALNVAGLAPLSLINETTSAALDWGIFKTTSLPEEEKDAIVIAFVDIGHSATTCTVASFSKGQLKVLGHVFDLFLGVRDFDYHLFEHFSVEVKKKYHVDLHEQKKNALKFLDSVEKCKKVLSANPVAILTCELGECDVSIPEITREVIEKLFAPLTDKLRQLLQRAIQIPGADRVTTVEIIGGGSRIPCLKACIAEVFQKPVQTTLNASESIARGCGIMGAMLSPKFKVREFGVIDSNYFTVNIGYFSEKPKTPHPEANFPGINQKKTVLGPGDACPKTFNLSFDRSDEFDLVCFYDENPALTSMGSDLLIGKWRIGGLPSLSSQPSVRVRLRVNPSMLISVEGAQVMEEWEEDVVVEEPVAKPEAKAEEGKTTTEPEKTASDASQPMQVDGQQEAVAKKIVKKKQSRKHECTVSSFFSVGNDAERLVDLKEQERQMIESDLNVHRTLEAKNSLEAFIYDMRSKVGSGGMYCDFITPKDRDSFSTALNDAESWLYGDGEDTAKDDYVEKLGHLQNGILAVTKRYNERKTLPSVVLSCQTRAKEFVAHSQNKEGKLSHLSTEELQSVAAKSQEFLNWLNSEVAKCESTPPTQDMPLSSATFQSKLKELENFCVPILTKPKPKPEKKETEPPAPAPAPAPTPTSEPSADKKEQQQPTTEMETDATPNPTPTPNPNPSKMDLD